MDDRRPEGAAQGGEEAAERPFPPLHTKGKDEMEATLADAVGDVVYGAAVVDGAIFLRTGTELYCVRKAR